ncbi:MAG: exo-alpha-sialidase [Acidobacteria bacterium]|nr:exo-alpha-sialidase [Acidobacteriota bacterium]
MFPHPVICTASKPFLKQVEVFRAGEAGYHTYRIPALVTTRKNTVLAFCEGRKNSRQDTGDIDLVLKRSFDGGRTWGKLQIIADHAADTIGNPTPVVDRDTGTIWLLLTKNLGSLTEKQILAGEGIRTVWVTSSTDDGATWSPTVEISRDTRDSNWTWYATGPGNGIQLKSGRLLIPCCHSPKGTRMYRSHVIYSDDHGKSWKLGGTVGDNADESAVVESSDGSLLINMRSALGRNRLVSRSGDQGASWSPIEADPALIEPPCQASILRFSSKSRTSKSRILFSNPADGAKRVTLTVRVSYDEGKTWPVLKLLCEAPSAYSALAVLRNHTVGCLYETGSSLPYDMIRFAQFNLEWLTVGGDHL